MFYIGPDQVTHRCVREDETYDILQACHDEPCGGHFAAKRTTYKVLTTTPILRGPDWKLPFHIHIDASDTALGAILGQKEGTVEHAIYYISKNL